VSQLKLQSNKAKKYCHNFAGNPSERVKKTPQKGKFEKNAKNAKKFKEAI